MKVCLDDQEIRDLQDAVGLARIAYEGAEDQSITERYAKLADKLMVALMTPPPDTSVAEMLGGRRIHWRG